MKLIFKLILVPYLYFVVSDFLFFLFRFNNRSKNKFDNEPNIIKSNDIPYRIIGM